MTTRMTSTHCTCTIAWRWQHSQVHPLSARMHALFHLPWSSIFTLAQVRALSAPHPHVIHVSVVSLTRPTPLSTSQLSSCLSSSSPSSTSATSSSRSSTRRWWKTCATPLPTGGEGHLRRPLPLHTCKTKLDNARKLRGIYFIPWGQGIQRNHQELSKVIGNANGSRHRCKRSKTCKHRSTRGKSNGIKSQLACIWKDRIFTTSSWRPYCRKKWKFITALQLGSQTYSYASSSENSLSKSSSGQGMGKLEKIPAWNLTKVRSKKEVIDEARTKGAKVHFASLMYICHLKNADLEQNTQNTKVEFVTPWWYRKDGSGSYAVFTEQ